MLKVFMFMLFIICVGCSPSSTEDTSLASPDGQFIAKVTTKVKRELWRGGPEPPKVVGKWVRLTISNRDKMVYDSSYEDIGADQRIPSALDYAWSPDSLHLAFRSVTTLHVIGVDGMRRSFEVIDLVRDNSLITSFKWISNKALLIVIKKIDIPIDSAFFKSTVLYGSYGDKALNIRLIRLDLDAGITERYSQEVHEPTFMFRSIGFLNQEISPYSDRVVFSDGTALCVYDDSIGKVIARAIISGNIEGTWWATNDQIIVGINLLGPGGQKIVVYDLVAGCFYDQTNRLHHRWNYKWDNEEWYK